MPTIAYFLGIAISMYYRDHNPPHIHVSYQGYEAIFAIDDARILGGNAAANGNAHCATLDNREARSVA